MDRYQRVEKTRHEEPIKENEIRITAQGLIRNYISYATALLQDKQVSEIVLKAMGQAISKTVAITEILKRRIPGLYQETSISSTSITDVWEPIEEGLVPVEMTRQVSLISITLSTMDLNKDNPGYQAPSYAAQPKSEHQYRQWQQQPRRLARDPTFGGNGDMYGRGRGRVRGRGSSSSRGRGYGNYRDNDGYWYGNSQENGGYRKWGHGGRGGGRDGGYPGAGYEGGRSGGGGGRGYSRGRGRMGGGRGRGSQL